MKNILIFLFFSLLVSGPGCRTESQNFAAGDEKDGSNVDMESTGENENHPEPDHTVLTISKQPFSFVIHTGGRIMADSKDIEIITAKSSGIVKFGDHFLFPGVRAVRGQTLFTLPGEQLAEDNSELRFYQIKADLEKAEANYERVKSLISDKIITQEHFLEVKNEYEKLLNEYNNLSGTFGASGNIITSPVDGFIREIYVTEGQKVTTGEPLASIVINHNLVLKADLSPDYLAALPEIEKANFTVGYSKRIFKTEELKGRKISFGKSTGENSYYIPVYFRMDYDPELIEGTFAEVYLIGKQIPEAIAVPNSALMEEYGKLYVFLEDEDGDFLKRYISTGNTDGEFTEVTDGLKEGDVIVATGAYNIKLSQMSGTIPGHTHNH
jgi:cobalt-zinc-cadmium efflux system membrane fusion protein